MAKLLVLTNAELSTLTELLANSGTEDDELKNKLSLAKESSRSEITVELADADEASDQKVFCTLELDDSRVWLKALTPEQHQVDIENKEDEYSKGLFGLIECRNGVPALSLGLEESENDIHVMSNSKDEIAVLPALLDRHHIKWGEVEFYTPPCGSKFLGYIFS